jgi:hypothetical protein
MQTTGNSLPQQSEPENNAQRQTNNNAADRIDGQVIPARTIYNLLMHAVIIPACLL